MDSRSAVHLLLVAGIIPVGADGTASNPAGTNAGLAVAGHTNTAVKAKIGKDEALAKLKAALSIPASYKLTAASFNGNSWDSENGCWTFNFESRSGDQVDSYLYGMIDGATGRLLGYNIYDSDADKPVVYPPKLDYAAAKALAFSLLKKMNPDEAASMIYDPSKDNAYLPPRQGKVPYYFRFDRIVNGVRYPTDSVTFNIDGSGKVIGYSFTWHPSVTFESPKPAIAAANALAAYKKAAKPYLQYAITGGQKPKHTLTYALEASPPLRGPRGRSGRSPSEPEKRRTRALFALPLP
jgi:hypothetical protein